jgi:hypothetical protein
MRWVYLEHQIDAGPVECSTKHVFERELETQIKAHAEKPKLAGELRAEPTVKPSGATPPPEGQVPPASDARLSSSSTVSGYAPLSSGRPNARLLAEPDFTRAITDLQALRFLAGFQEVGSDSLQVEVSDDALKTNLSEYSLGRLFGAYYRITGWSPGTIGVFSHSGQLLGTYNRSGLVIRQ